MEQDKKVQEDSIRAAKQAEEKPVAMINSNRAETRFDPETEKKKAKILEQQRLKAEEEKKRKIA